jgi:hypothetical protein
MDGDKTIGAELRSLIRGVIEEFVHAQQVKAEPGYKTELLDERKRREDLERRVNDLVHENTRSRQMAEEAERSSSIRAELLRLGVAKVDLAYRAVKDEVYRADDGQLLGRSGSSNVPLRDYLKVFVQENPELLPARITGGSGIGSGARAAQNIESVGLDRIRPGMSAEEMERVRKEVSRVASQTLRGM